jgi:hypothetical protein
MICAVHAILGAALGSFARTRSHAFVVGVGTHLLADLAPHRDFSPLTETVLVGAAVTAIAATAGADSPAFAGALGGVAPDLENGLCAAGLTQCRVFPTHQQVHGRRTSEVWSQALISAAALAVVAWRAGKARAETHSPIAQARRGQG